MSKTQKEGFNVSSLVERLMGRGCAPEKKWGFVVGVLGREEMHGR